MLVVRLSRTGRSKYPTYRVVIADSRRAVTGKVVAQVGSYNPHTKETVLNKEAITKYIANGAQPSSRVVKLLQAEGVELPDWAKKNLVVRNRKPKKEAEPAAEAVAEASEEAVAEEPAEAVEAPTEEAVAAEAETSE